MNKKNIYYTIIINILTLLCVSFLLVTGVSMVRTKLLKNAQSMGMSLAKSYGLEEEQNIEMFENFLTLGSRYVNEISHAGQNRENIQRWMMDYFAKLTDILGENTVDLYAVIDGQIIAQSPWSGDEGYHFQDTQWYQLAIEHKNEICFTDIYRDAITQDMIITASISLESDGDVFAMDIYPDRIHEQEKDPYDLIENSSLLVCDSHGQAIYTSFSDKYTSEEITTYTKKLFSEIEKGKLDDYDTSFTDNEGVNRGVYYSKLNNGWMVILTIPMNDLLMEDGNMIIYGLIFVGIFLMMALVILFIRDLFHYKKMSEADKTIDILSESFYAIYRLDIVHGTYKAIKGSSDLKQTMNQEGKYEELLNAVETVVQKETYQEFLSCFSLDSIRQRVKDNVMDYGGDYLRLFDGVYRWVNIRTLYNNDISQNVVILCFKDIDVEKKQELQQMVLLEEALQAGKKNIEAKNTFFNNMSHDLRTPLNAIIGLTELATKNNSFAKVKDYLHKIAFSGQQMLTLVNDILELSQMESGNRDIHCQPFDLESCIKNVCEIFEAKKLKEDKQFDVVIDLIHKDISSDETKIIQILTNIISNSFKYTEPGDRIILEAKEKEYYHFYQVCFTIEDTGIGMSKDFLKHIFEPYAREKHFSKNTVVGTGLGMPIVKNLIEMLNGEIKIESEPGQGTKTTIIIPVYLPEHEQNTYRSEEKNASLNILTGKKILLVEDNTLNMEIATDLLEMNGVQVTQAENGQEALDKFIASSAYFFDLILMDMKMPVMDGCQATAKIRSLDRADAKTVPIVALSANAFSEDIDQALRAGMNGHLSKPIDLTALCKTLYQYFDR